MIYTTSRFRMAVGVALIAGTAVLTGCNSPRATTRTTTEQTTTTTPRPVESTTTTTTQELRRP
jgi:uncharacterized lipoprotein YajG